MDVMTALAEIGSVTINQHFIYSSGKHGSGYVNFDPVFTNLELVRLIAGEMVNPFVGDCDTIVGIATGGIVWAVTCAEALIDAGADVAMCWADKDGNGEFVFERDGFIEAVADKDVLVVDDVMTNPNPIGSAYKVCRLVEACGGRVIGVSLACNRCNATAEQLDVPRLSQVGAVSFMAMFEKECELCRDSVPIVEDVGHGAKYKQGHPDYPGGYIKLISQ